MRDVVAVEALKLRRAPVTAAASVLGAAAMPLLALAFVRLAGTDATSPMAAKLGGMVVGTGWAAFLGTLGQLVAVGQFLAVGFVTVWCFGREFSDGTVGSLFALPVTRGRIAGAKFIVVGGWAAASSCLLVAVAAGIGAVAGFDTGGIEVVDGLARLLVLALLTSILALPLGLAASLGRGYLAGTGTLIGVVAVSQVAVLFGAGGWFPFAAPGLWAVGWQEPDLVVTLPQLALVPVCALVGVAVTTQWWNRFELR